MIDGLSKTRPAAAGKAVTRWNDRDGYPGPGHFTTPSFFE